MRAETWTPNGWLALEQASDAAAIAPVANADQQPSPNVEDAAFFARRASQQLRNLEAGLIELWSLTSASDVAVTSDTLALGCAAVERLLIDVERALASPTGGTRPLATHQTLSVVQEA